jgi:hypothetical protein
MLNQQPKENDMPQIAYYREVLMTGPPAIAMVTALHKAAASILGPDHIHTAYLADFVVDVTNGSTFAHIERVKVEVKDVEEALAVANRPDFLRYFIGARTLEEIIAERKREGRADWYV